MKRKNKNTFSLFHISPVVLRKALLGVGDLEKCGNYRHICDTQKRSTFMKFICQNYYLVKVHLKDRNFFNYVKELKSLLVVCRVILYSIMDGLTELSSERGGDEQHDF